MSETNETPTTVTYRALSNSTHASLPPDASRTNTMEVHAPQPKPLVEPVVQLPSVLTPLMSGNNALGLKVPNHISARDTEKPTTDSLTSLMLNGVTALSNALPDTDYQNIRAGQSEYTDYRTFGLAIFNLWLQALDSTIVSVINWILVGFAQFAWVMGILTHLPMVYVNKWMRQKLYPITLENTGQVITLSNVNVIEPELLTSYQPDFAESSANATGNVNDDDHTDCSEDDESSKPTSLFFSATKVNMNSTAFSLPNALLLAHLCSLTYEPLSTIVALVKMWGLTGVKALDRRSAAAYMFYSIEHNFVAVVFKGTSPLDLTQWFTDFMLQQTPAKGGALPGQVHHGFSSLMEFTQRKLTSGRTQPTGPQASSSYYDELIRLLGTTCTLPGMKNPSVWISGHSLGAALATMFFSALHYALAFPVTGMKLQQLKGGYVFASPRIGDSDFVSGVNNLAGRHFYRISNANDMASHVPLRFSMVTTKLIRDYQTIFDYEHIGIPVALDLTGHCEVNVKRGLVHIVKNYALFWISLALLPVSVFLPMDEPKDLITGLVRVRKMTIWGAFVKLMMIQGFVDHLPNEYIANLKWAQEREAKKGAMRALARKVIPS